MGTYDHRCEQASEMASMAAQLVASGKPPEEVIALALTSIAHSLINIMSDAGGMADALGGIGERLDHQVCVEVVNSGD